MKIFAEIWDLTLAVPALKLIIQLSYIQGLGWNSIIICGQSSLVATALSFLQQVTLFLFYESRCHVIEIRFAVLCDLCLYHPVSSFALTKLCVICFDRKTHSIQNAEQFPSQNKTLLPLPHLNRIFTLKEQKQIDSFFMYPDKEEASLWVMWADGGRKGWTDDLKVLQLQGARAALFYSPMHTAAPCTRTHGWWPRASVVNTDLSSLPARGCECLCACACACACVHRSLQTK